MPFEPFDLGRVIQTAEVIKGMRRQETQDVLREQYLLGGIAGQQQQQQFAAQDQQMQMDKATAEKEFLRNQEIENAADPHRAAMEIAPDIVQKYDQAHGQGAFAALDPRDVKSLAGYAKAKAAGLAGINLRPDANVMAQQQFQREQQQSQFGQQAKLAGIQHQNQLSEIAAQGAEARKTAEVSAPGKAMKGAQALRKEFEGLETVKNYRAVQPIIESAKKAPDNGYGDLNLIYAAGKILDPGSVVREGELALTIASGSPLQRLLGTTRFSIEKGGRLTPQSRRQLVGMLQGRVSALEDSFVRERDRFSQYATEAGMQPDQVVGAVQQAAAGPSGGAKLLYVPGQGFQPVGQ